MPRFEYQSLNKHLESRGRFLGAIVNHILRTAQDNITGEEIDIAAEDIPYEYDFLQDRDLLAEMLAERPEIAFVEAHNNGFSLRLQGPKQAIDQAEFDAIAERHYNFLNNLPGGECADFSGMELSGLEMRHVDLSGANFSGAELNGCDMEHGSFEDCDFGGAHFYGVQASDASFDRSKFIGTHIEGCNYAYVNLQNGNFTNALFEDVNLHHAKLDWSIFYGAQFENTDPSAAFATQTKGLPTSQPLNEKQVALAIIHARHTLWQHGEFDGVQADFSFMDLKNLDFSGKDFDGALFMQAELSGCNLSDCSLIHVDFSDAIIEGCDFRNANCQCATFADAQVHGCDMTDMNFDSMELPQAGFSCCEGWDDSSFGPTMTM